jgi:hypothetical protein
MEDKTMMDIDMGEHCLQDYTLNHCVVTFAREKKVLTSTPNESSEMQKVKV